MKFYECCNCGNEWLEENLKLINCSLACPECEQGKFMIRVSTSEVKKRPSILEEIKRFDPTKDKPANYFRPN